MTLYGPSIAAGILCCYHSARRDRAVREDPGLAAWLPWLFVLVVVASVIGGRLVYWLLVPEDNESWWSGAGFAFHGSLILSLACLPPAIRMMKLSQWVTLAVLVHRTPLVLAFGRIGCFTGGCCHGGSDGHPVQLYESAGALVLFFVCSKLRRRDELGILTVLRVLTGLAVLRLATSCFRGDLPPLMEYGGLKLRYGHAASLALATLIGVLWRLRPQANSSS